MEPATMTRESIQPIMNGTQEDQEKNRKAAGNAESQSENQDNFATPRMKRKAIADPEERTPKQTPSRDLSLMKDDFDSLLKITAENLSKENEHSPRTPMETLPSDKDKCQFPNCQSDHQSTPSRCFTHMIIHGSRRFQCSECDFTTNYPHKLGQHLKGNCGGESVDKLDQGMFDEWRQLLVICYPKRAKEIDALITKKERKFLASSNLQIDRDATKEMKMQKTMEDQAPTNSNSHKISFSQDSRSTSTKCQFPNCQSKGQHDSTKKCFQHLITHGPKRFTCSNCDSTGYNLSNIKKHFQSKARCKGEIVDNTDQTMIDEWTKLATICFPNDVRKLSDLIAKELAKQNTRERIDRPQLGKSPLIPTSTSPCSQSMNDVRRLNHSTTSGNSIKQPNDVPHLFLSLMSSRLKDEGSPRTQPIQQQDSDFQLQQNTGETIPQIGESPLIPTSTSPCSQSMNDVRRLNHSTTSGNPLIQPNDVPSLSFSLMSSTMKDEDSPGMQPIQQQDSDLQLQQLTQEVLRLRAEKRRLSIIAVDEKNRKEVAQKLLGQRDTEIEMQKETIRQLQAKFGKAPITLD